MWDRLCHIIDAHGCRQLAVSARLFASFALALVSSMPGVDPFPADLSFEDVDVADAWPDTPADLPLLRHDHIDELFALGRSQTP